MSNTIRFLLLIVGLLCAGLLSLAVGSVTISLQDLWNALTGSSSDNVASMILWQMRIPRALTAVFAGAGLSVAGLLMQTVFRNQLAGPYMLGVSSGAGLGVALVMLIGFGTGTWFGPVVAATIGAGLVMTLVLWLARFCRSSVSLLILGMMIGYLVDSMVSLLIHFGDPTRLQAFVNWGFGSFGRANWSDLRILGTVVLVGLFLTVPALKYLNAILLGESAAQSLGISVRRNRIIALGAASLLAAVVTVYCGPIGFLGLAVPHLARGMFRTANHRILLPASALCGAGLALLAGWVANLPTQGGVLPLNSVTALIGVPVVFWALLKGRGQTDE